MEEKKESGVVNDCENPSSVGNLLRKLFKALNGSLALARSILASTRRSENVASLHGYMLKERLEIAVAC